MTPKDRILQEKTRYVNKIKEVDRLILQLQDEKREYQKVVKIKNDELEEINQPKLF